MNNIDLLLQDVDILNRTLDMRDKSKNSLTLNILESFTQALNENSDAYKDCTEVLNRPQVSYYSDLRLGSCIQATLQ